MTSILKAPSLVDDLTKQPVPRWVLLLDSTFSLRYQTTNWESQPWSELVPGERAQLTINGASKAGFQVIGLVERD